MTTTTTNNNAATNNTFSNVSLSQINGQYVTVFCVDPVSGHGRIGKAKVSDGTISESGLVAYRMDGGAAYVCCRIQKMTAVDCLISFRDWALVSKS